jgi:hypothetical protein
VKPDGRTDVGETLFDRPLRRDWLFWWAVVLAVMGFAATSNAYPDGVTNDGAAVAFLIDAGLRVAFYVGLGAVGPALIRRNRRNAAKG